MSAFSWEHWARVAATGIAPPTCSTSATSRTPPPTPPFDWIGVIGTEQSLSIGATAKNINRTQPFKNLKFVDDGPAPKYPIDGIGMPQWSAVPLIEPIRPKPGGTGPGDDDGQYPSNIAGEPPTRGWPIPCPRSGRRTAARATAMWSTLRRWAREAKVGALIDDTACPATFSLRQAAERVATSLRSLGRRRLEG